MSVRTTRHCCDEKRWTRDGVVTWEVYVAGVHSSALTMPQHLPPGVPMGLASMTCPCSTQRPQVTGVPEEGGVQVLPKSW